jgi:hypothetical protein
MSRTKGHNMRRYAGHKEILAEKAETKARDPEFDELCALRDWAECVAASAQHALGFYGSGGDVPRDRVASSRAYCEALLKAHPTIAEALARFKR